MADVYYDDVRQIVEMEWLYSDDGNFKGMGFVTLNTADAATAALRHF